MTGDAPPVARLGALLQAARERLGWADADLADFFAHDVRERGGSWPERDPPLRAIEEIDKCFCQKVTDHADHTPASGA